MTNIVTKKSLISMFGDVRDQGQRPTCLAFAASDVHSAVRGAWVPLSCEYIFYRAQQRASRKPIQGATIPAMLDALRHDGQPPEVAWTYLDSLPTDLKDWCPKPGIAPLFRRAASLITAPTIDAIVSELDKNRPVLTALMLSSSFYYAVAPGVVSSAAGEKPDVSRRHAVIALGHGEVDGERAILVRNSWGNGWGDQGHAWLTDSYLLPRLLRLVLLEEDLSVSPNSATG